MAKFRRKGHVTSVGELLSKWLQRRKIDTDLDLHRLRNEWVELVGDRLGVRTWPKRLRDGLLTVNVASSAWQNELTFLRVDLVKRINETMDGARVKAIRFSVGPVDRTTEERRKVTAIERAEVELPQAYLDEVESEVAGIADEELKENIRRARLAQLRRRLRGG